MDARHRPTKSHQLEQCYKIRNGITTVLDVIASFSSLRASLWESSSDSGPLVEAKRGFFAVTLRSDLYAFRLLLLEDRAMVVVLRLWRVEDLLFAIVPAVLQRRMNSTGQQSW